MDVIKIPTFKEQRASTRKTMKFLNEHSHVSNVEIDAILKNKEGEVTGFILKLTYMELNNND
jgi:hypothetical protein